MGCACLAEQEGAAEREEEKCPGQVHRALVRSQPKPGPEGTGARQDEAEGEKVGGGPQPGQAQQQPGGQPPAAHRHGGGEGGALLPVCGLFLGADQALAALRRAVAAAVAGQVDHPRLQAGHQHCQHTACTQAQIFFKHKYKTFKYISKFVSINVC